MSLDLLDLKIFLKGFKVALKSFENFIVKETMEVKSKMDKCVCVSLLLVSHSHGSQCHAVSHRSWACSEHAPSLCLRRISWIDIANIGDRWSRNSSDAPGYSSL